MDITAAITIALEAIPPEERSIAVDNETRKHVHANAVRLVNIARSMLAGQQLPRECVAMIFTAIAEDLEPRA